MKWLYTGSALFVFCFVQVGCKVRQSDSGVKLDNGIIVDAKSKNKINHVFAVTLINRAKGLAGGCTGTAVSADTMIFAAHCVYDVDAVTPMPDNRLFSIGNAQVCVSNATLTNVCASNVYISQNYLPTNTKQMTYDVAIAIFDNKPFKAFAEIENGKLAVTEEVAMVGYSKVGVPTDATSTKAWGFNTIVQFLSDITIVSVKSTIRKGYGVAVSPGDSGGPLFRSCKLAGIASRMTLTDPKYSLHTNLTWSENREWLIQTKQIHAHICGLHALDATFCPVTARIRPNPDPQEEVVYPCIEAPLASTIPASVPRK